MKKGAEACLIFIALAISAHASDLTLYANVAGVDPTATGEVTEGADFVPNYHLTGWFNTFVPGGGEFLQGNTLKGVEQALLEIGTFGAGFALSRRSPMTLDGVPEQIPRFAGRRRLNTQSDISKELFANLLQEFGLKYHMVNVFNSYRTTAGAVGIREGIDQTSDLQLFLVPFQKKNIYDPWVYVPLAISTVVVAIDYLINQNAVANRQARLTPSSNYLYAVNYAAVLPFGSGAPEEMFYRGFIQNELNPLGPYVSIPVSTAAYALSHESGRNQIVAAITGAYLGSLAYIRHGELSANITLHFWSDVLAGVEALLLSAKGQHTLPPASFSVQVNY